MYIHVYTYVLALQPPAHTYVLALQPSCINQEAEHSMALLWKYVQKRKSSHEFPNTLNVSLGALMEVSAKNGR